MRPTSPLSPTLVVKWTAQPRGVPMLKFPNEALSGAQCRVVIQRVQYNRAYVSGSIPQYKRTSALRTRPESAGRQMTRSTSRRFRPHSKSAAGQPGAVCAPQGNGLSALL